MIKGFESKRDEPCRAFIITRLNDKGERQPIAYDGHPGHPGKPILELMLPDSTIEYIIEIQAYWRKFVNRQSKSQT